jgi:hypothetical protein
MARMPCLYCDRPVRKLHMCNVHYTRMRRHGHPTSGLQDVVPERVDRDPCFLCGCRGDVGCRHRIAA